MTPDTHKQVRDHRLSLEFDELTGRATPPDRLHDILAGKRVPSGRQQRLDVDHVAPASRDRGRLAAVLVVFALGVTTIIFARSNRDDDAEQSAQPQPAATVAAVQSKQDKQKKKAGKQDKPKPPVAKRDPATKKDPAKAQPPMDHDKAKRASLRAELEAVLKARRAKEAEMTAKAAMEEFLRANEAARAKDPNTPLKAGQVKRARELAALLGKLEYVKPRARVGKAATLRVRELLNRGGFGSPRGPMQQGEMGKAVARIRESAQDLGRAGSAAAAQKILDELERAVVAARREVWELKKKEKQNEPK